MDQVEQHCSSIILQIKLHSYNYLSNFEIFEPISVSPAGSEGSTEEEKMDYLHDPERLGEVMRLTGDEE